MPSLRFPAWLNPLLRRIPRHLLAAAAVIFLLFFLEATQIINCRERDAYDFRMKHRAAEKAHRDIVLLAVDDVSLQALGPWPWRRSMYADLIHILKDAGARVIFFDMIFPEKSQSPEDDQKFAGAVRKAGNVIIPFHYIDKPFRSFFPIPELKESSPVTGYVNVEVDPRDGVVREVKPFLPEEKGGYAYCAQALFLSLFGDEEARREWIADFQNRHGRRLLVNYPGGLESFQRLSVGEVFEKSRTDEGRLFLQKALHDKIILIGDIATGSSDVRTIPLQASAPGIVIPASVLNTLITGHYLYELPMWANYLLAFLLAWLTAWLVQQLRPQWASIASAALITIYTLINIWVFSQFRIVAHLPMPIVAVLIVFVASLFMRYVDIRIQSDFLARELEMASKIQQSLLPAAELKQPKVEAGFRCLFYERVGGDLYDWMDLGEGRIGLCLGDVSGKGVPAALYMARALNELRHHAVGSAAPGEILSALNRSLSQGETSGMFLTLFFVILDTVSGRMRFANAGHDAMVFYRATSRQAELVGEAGGLPIGIMDDQVFETGEIAFASGDILLITSDGIKEQKSQNGSMFGSERLQRALEKAAGSASAEAVMDSVMADVLRFAEGRPPHDDRTLVCAKML